MLRYLERNHDKIQTWDQKKTFDLKNVVWFDLVSPSRDEELFLENQLGFTLPSRSEMVEIELSSRLYCEDDTFFMTATMISHSD